jgi:hypothetical protein
LDPGVGVLEPFADVAEGDDSCLTGMDGGVEPAGVPAPDGIAIGCSTLVDMVGAVSSMSDVPSLM